MISSLLENFQKHKVLHLASLTTLTVSFSIIVSFFNISLNFKTALLQWSNSLQMTVYVKDSATENQMSNVQSALSKIDGVEDIQFLSKTQAIKLFEEKMGGYAPDLLRDKDFENPLPASYVLNLKKNKDWSGVDARMRDIAGQAEKLAGVESVSFGHEWLKNYASMVSGIEVVGIIIGVALLFGAGFVISSVIRSSVFQRKDEIEILELVGATTSMIRKPFIIEGVVVGALSAVLAIAISYGVYQFQVGYLQNHFEFFGFLSRFQFLSVSNIMVIISMGSLTGAAASWLSVRGINNGWAQSTRLKAGA